MNQDNNPFLYGGSEPPKESMPSGDRGIPHNPKSKKILTLILAIVAVVLVFVIFALVNNGYTVKNTVINGSSPYSEEQLVEIIEEYCNEINSKSFFYINASELTSKYYEKLPYLKSVNVEKKYPDTLIITIEGEEAQCFFEAFDAYYIINREMKVLERTEMKPASLRLLEITLATPTEISVGKELAFEEGTPMDKISFDKLYSALEASSMRYDVKFISAENKFELSMILRSGVDVKIGSIKDVEEKIATLKKWLDENPGEISSDLNLDISILKKITVSRD